MTKVHNHGLAPVLSASCRASPSLGRTKAHTPSHQCSAPLLACSAPPRWAVGPLYPAQPTYLLSWRTDGSLGAGKTLVGKSGVERSETGWLRTFPCCHPPFPTLPSGHGPHSRPPPGRGCFGGRCPEACAHHSPGHRDFPAVLGGQAPPGGPTGNEGKGTDKALESRRG